MFHFEQTMLHHIHYESEDLGNQCDLAVLRTNHQARNHRNMKSSRAWLAECPPALDIKSVSIHPSQARRSIPFHTLHTSYLIPTHAVSPNPIPLPISNIQQSVFHHQSQYLLRMTALLYPSSQPRFSNSHQSSPVQSSQLNSNHPISQQTNQ